MQSSGSNETPKAITEHTPKKQESGFYEPYSTYHRSVRLWFLAYGIGVPVFLTQFPGAIDSLRACGMLRWITALFLGGVALQILIAMFYNPSAAEFDVTLLLELLG